MSLFKAVKESPFTLHKFGRNDAVAAGEAVWMASRAVNLHASAATMYASSTSTSDTAKSIKIYYIDSTGAQQEVSVTLNGQSFVNTGVSAQAVNRAYLETAGADLVGDVYLSQTNTGTGGVPTDGTKIMAVIPEEDNQTMSAVYLVPNAIKGIPIEGFWMAGGAAHASGNTANSYCQLKLKFKTPTGARRTLRSTGLTPGTTIYREFPIQMFFPPGTWIWVEVESTSSITDVDAEFWGELDKD